MSAQALAAPQRQRKTSRGVRTPSRRERGSQRRLGTEKRVKRFPFIGSDALPDRMWAKIVLHEDTRCWEWTGYKTKEGYGSTTLNGKRMSAHRATFLAFRGYLPDWKRGKGLCLDHYLFPKRCIGPACCNPYHLKVTTPRQNVLRSDIAPAAVAARRTECSNGHEYTEETTAVYAYKGDPNKPYRICKICNVERMRAWKAANANEWRAYQRDWMRNKRAQKRAAR